MNPKNPIFLLFSFFSSSRKKPRLARLFVFLGMKTMKTKVPGTGQNGLVIPRFGALRLALLEQIGDDRFFFFQFGFRQFDFLAGEIAEG